jgi:hypothetical protein
MRQSFRLAWRATFAFMLMIYGPIAILKADQPPKVQTLDVRLASGRAATCTIHFDRNSLQASIRVGNGLIALTTSGALLRFELPAIQLIRERIGTEEITCIGHGQGETILAGLSDGRVCRVEPATLDFTDVAKLPAAPAWLGFSAAAGTRRAGLVAVVREEEPVQQDGRQWLVRRSVVHDLAARTKVPLELEVGAFLLDSSGRLWLGADRGEWGGWIGRVDLFNGTVAELKPPHRRGRAGRDFWEGVYGFIETNDGRVLAFGGTSHMGMNSCFITRIDRGEPIPILGFESDRAKEVVIGPVGPTLPITHMIEEAEGLLVLSYSDVFRVDSQLRRWKKVATLEIDYRWGRRDAVGAYPSVCVIHPRVRQGDAYVLATIADGYVSLDGAKSTSRAIPGQLGASSASLIKNTSEGTLVLEGDDRLPCWRRGSNRWEIAALAPPLEPDPDDADMAAFEKRDPTWDETSVLVDSAGIIYTVSGTGVSPGTRTTARRKNGKSERIGRERSSLFPSSSFLTGDGRLWNAFYGELQRFENGRWKIVARLPEGARGPGSLRPVNTAGPPWILLDDFQHVLWKLDHGASGDNPRLTHVELKDRDKPLQIHDAIVWSAAQLLLATSAGLKFYETSTAKFAPAALPEPPQPATTLVRDARGRLWLGGRGLWLLDAGSTSLEAFDRVPWISHRQIDDIEPDPLEPDGVIAALGSGGVAFVRAGQKR